MSSSNSLQPNPPPTNSGASPATMERNNANDCTHAACPSRALVDEAGEPISGIQVSISSHVEHAAARLTMMSRSMPLLVT